MIGPKDINRETGYPPDFFRGFDDARMGKAMKKGVSPIYEEGYREGWQRRLSDPVEMLLSSTNRGDRRNR